MKISPAARVQQLLDVYGDVDSRCDGAIAKGIQNVRAWLQGNPSGSLESTKFPLLCVIREQVDDPFSTFALRTGLPSFCFSNELLRLRSDLAAYIETIYKELAESFDKERTWVGYLYLEDKFPGFQWTLNSLIDFIYLCSAMVGPTETVVTLERRPSGTVFNISTGKKSQRDTERRPDGVPIYRFFDDNQLHLCELCSCMTEHLVERIECLSSKACQPSFASDAIKALNEGARLATPQFSTRFCAIHAPQQGGGAAYKRALKRRELYHAMRRFLIIVQHEMGSGVNLISDRASAFSIVDSYPSQSLISRIPKLIDAYYDAISDTSENNPLVRDILEKMAHLHAIFEQDRHPLAPLVEAYKKGTGDTYTIALELGVIPRNVDSNLIEVWPVMAEMVNFGKIEFF